MTNLVLSVFMLQVIATGFCMPMASASPIAQAPMMEHCMPSTMQMQVMEIPHQEDTQHACAHCDLPDASMSLEKHGVFMGDTAVVLWFVTFIPAEAAAPLKHTHHLFPPLRTALFTFDLNQRFRV